MKAIRRMQEKKLRGFVRLLYHHHPYYRRLMKKLKLTPGDIKKVDDLKKLPLTTKMELRENPKAFVLQPQRKTLRKTLSLRQKLSALLNMEKFKEKMKWEYAPVTFFASSGRAGTPTPAFMTRYDLELLKVNTMAAIKRITKGIKRPVGQNMFPFAPHLAFWHVTLGVLDYQDMFWIAFGAGRTELQVDVMEKFKVNVIAGMPTFVKRISDVMVEKEKRSYVRRVVLGGESAPKGLVKAIKDNFSRNGPEPQVIQGYGLTESKMAILECREGSGYHIFPHIHIWELVDKNTFEPVEEDGLIVFSHIDMRGTVFLRYLTGDFLKGEIVEEECPYCGSMVPRIEGKIKRIVDMEKNLRSTKVKGTLIDLDVFDEILSEIEDIEQYQVIIKKENEYDPYSRDIVEIYVGPKKHVINIEELVRMVKEKVKSYTEITPRIKIKSPSQIFEEVMGPLKGVRVIDKRERTKG
ncbi:MAG: AMP-binding protein [Nanoarchaeota archaeon]|nr:AMP-binding protein [Nanoarchaeota archaeon]